jgi:hypothetical protein
MKNNTKMSDLTNLFARCYFVHKTPLHRNIKEQEITGPRRVDSKIFLKVASFRLGFFRNFAMFLDYVCMHLYELVRKPLFSFD